MESRIAKALELKISPVALIWTDERHEGALQYKAGKFGCVMWLVTSAAKGRPAICDADTCGCFGGGVGLGFGNMYVKVPGGMEGFSYFLSVGYEKWALGGAIAEQMKPFMSAEVYDNFVHGERYFHSPKEVRKFVEMLPMTEIPARYVLFKQLAEVREAQEKPQVVIFFADPDQLAALVVLANYRRGDNENVVIPYAAGCQTIGIYPYREAQSERPKAVVGLTDITVRLHIRKQLGPNLVTFAVPIRLFDEMEANLDGSFVERPVWQEIMEDRRKQ